MRILVISDLHLEVWRNAPRQAQDLLAALSPDPDSSQPDLVILAGDIDIGDRAVAWAHKMFPNIPVIYVHGNHEGYGQNIDTLKVKLAAACSATGHMHLLDKGELVLGNVRVLGATLWTDFSLMGTDRIQAAMQAAAAGMNDYRKIRLAKGGYRKIKPLDVAQWHYEDRIWLEEHLNEPFDGFTVVVTHMAPSSHSVPERYKDQLMSAAFASELNAMVSLADLWVHGHVHDSMDYRLGKARVVCNPLGYPLRSSEGNWSHENAMYDPNLIVEIGTLGPAQQILQDAAAKREELAAQWLSVSRVDELLNLQQRNGAQGASQLRRDGQLLGVYVSDAFGSYRYPAWQFGLDGQPVVYLTEILAVLRDFGPFIRESGGLRRTTGWGEAEWFLCPHALLGGVCPADMLMADSAKVLLAACIEFKSPGREDY